MEEEKHEEQAPEENAEEATAGSDDEGDKPETPQSIVDANAAAERIENATLAAKKENDRAEAGEVRRKLGGSTEAGSGPAAPKEDTRTPDEKADDYVKKLDKGEVNPLKEDGFI